MGYVSHQLNILSNGIRWISRTATEDALGMVLPATAEHIGYENAKNTGQLKILPSNESVEFYMEAGYLDKEDADKIRKNRWNTKKGQHYLILIKNVVSF